jgi:hypothetical protein
MGNILPHFLQRIGLAFRLSQEQKNSVVARTNLELILASSMMRPVLLCCEESILCCSKNPNELE